MSTTTIIQLRQQEADYVDSNGIYKVNLQNPVTVEEGDVVQVKSVFLDTTAEGAGVIEIEDDTPCDIECMLYITNYNKDQRFKPVTQSTDPAGGTLPLRLYDNSGENTRTVEERGDNQKYFLAEAVTGTGDAFRVSGFDVIPQNKSSLSKRFGGCDITYSYMPYTPPNATKRVFGSKHVPSFRDYKWNSKNPYNIDVICKATPQETPDFRIESSQSYLDDNHIEEIDFKPYVKQLTDPTADHFLTPQLFNFDFILPKGSYTPAELVDTINDLIVNIQKDGPVDDSAGSAANPPTRTKWQSASPFLQTVLQNYQATETRGTAQCLIPAVTGQIDATTKAEMAGTHFMTYNQTQMCAEFSDGGAKLVPPVDRWLGTNQIALAYDQSQNKIKWDLIHFPVYVNDSSSPDSVVNDAVPGIQWNLCSTFGPFYANSGLALQYGGIAFTKLQPDDLWQSKMGFSNVCVTPQMNAKCPYPAATDAPAVNNCFTFDCVDGINTTGALPALDIAIQHNNEFYSRPVFDDGASGDLDVSTSDTTSCFSKRVWNTSLADEGYFLIDVSPNFNQKLVGKQAQTTTTQSIISRYYTANGFTNDMGSGSIVYEHKGEPMTISDMEVRILNPDRSPVDPHILSPKNTVFLEVIKNQSQ